MAGSCIKVEWSPGTTQMSKFDRCFDHPRSNRAKLLSALKALKSNLA